MPEKVIRAISDHPVIAFLILAVGLVIIFNQHWNYDQRFTSVEMRVAQNEIKIAKADTQNQLTTERIHRIEISLQEIQGDQKYIIKSLDEMKPRRD